MAKGKKLPPGWEKYANSKSNNIWKEKNKQRNPIVKEDVVVSYVSDEFGNDESINIETITTDEAICETVQPNDINENFNIEVEEEDLAIEDQNITELESVNTYEFNSDDLIENIKATPTCSDSEIHDIDENTNIEIITTDEAICETVHPNDISESFNIEVEEEDLANDGQNITEPESDNIDDQFEGMVDKYSLGISVKSSGKKKNKKKFVVIALILLVFVIAVTSVVVVLAKKNNSKQKSKFHETEYVYIPESSDVTTAYEEIITDEVVEEPVSDENVESSVIEMETNKNVGDSTSETEIETERETESVTGRENETETEKSSEGVTEPIITEIPTSPDSSDIFNEYDFLGFWYPASYGETELTIRSIDSTTVSFSLSYYSHWTSDIITATIVGATAYFYEDEIEGALIFYNDSIGLYYTKTNDPYISSHFEYIFSDKRDYSLHTGESFYKDQTTNWQNYTDVWSSCSVMHSHENTTCYDTILCLQLNEDNSIYFNLELCDGNKLYSASSGRMYLYNNNTYRYYDFDNKLLFDLIVYDEAVELFFYDCVKTNNSGTIYYDLKIK